MLTWLADFSHIFGPFNLFRYLTFRSGAACLTALLVSFVLGPMFIRWLKSVPRTNGSRTRNSSERWL